ncbi:ankyrin repeat-containing protein ITN1-like [Pyrus x bretschneideri]|uniref:ankyrin repeat-containing protein ITN1-like n=1 Tax=Pyrus x bretschneideri TaxID=225117 RepID=UPI00202ED5D8|nr:ankyrin repeat-containing protein ITN1-like [Pyrus x bretschneideri]
MCKAVSEGSIDFYKQRKLKEALYMAAERGHVEYITHFLTSSSYPILDFRYKNDQKLLQIAAESRHYNVYNIICEFLRKPDKDGLNKSEYGQHSDKLKKAMEYKDNLDNNILHTVARITPLSQIDHIQGAILQMQRELQWFKEVESIAEPKDCESVNKDNKTPRKVFKENHKELGKEAENSMKETATSCTVVGALIVTIMFAAAFTVPGENDKNDEKTDLPIFLTNKVFTTFIVSDAISLFSSTTSVIMFLGILTSRYSEDDFHKSLPTKMIIGLFTLFLSIATMMIVFSCGLYIILDGKSSIVIPSILLASVPVASFIWMQFPLLKDLSISTFGQGVFDRKQKNLF